MDKSMYHVPTALTAISGVFLCLGAICVLAVTADIAVRRGWKSMMWIMIPVYIINAAYMPISTYVYLKYGRPAKPQPGQPTGHCHHGGGDEHTDHAEHTGHDHADDIEKDADMSNGSEPANPADHEGHEGHEQHHEHMHAHHDPTTPSADTPADKAEHSMAHHHHHHDSSSRPMLATVLVGVAHCGAGCVLGDLVGEWLVYGTGAQISGTDLWPALLIDYGFALLFGIAFQYFSIAPMSGEYGPRTVWRAAKADVLSLTSFEVGAFGWMIAYQAGIWGYRLDMNTWLYWWQMQIAMALGFVTALPVNWWLITRGIKEPCA